MPRGSSGGSDDVPPAEIYRVAVEEYRFQAQYNWSRTQYLLGLNVVVLAAGAAIATDPDRRGAWLVFLFGALAASLSVLVVRQQHDYYRAARDRMRRVEAEVGIPVALRMDTTSTLGSRKRTLSVNQVVFLLLGALAVADLTGVGLVLMR